MGGLLVLVLGVLGAGVGVLLLCVRGVRCLLAGSARGHSLCGASNARPPGPRPRRQASARHVYGPAPAQRTSDRSVQPQGGLKL